MNLRPVSHLLGVLLLGLAVAMVIPILVDIVEGGVAWPGYIVAAGLTLLLAGLMIAGGDRRTLRIGLRQGFALTVGAWVLLAAAATLPFLFSGYPIGVTDAAFEAVSGITTTGSTVLVGVDQVPASLLVWRSLLQWLGGFGVIAMALLLLPFLRVGGMHIFHTESADRLEKVLPRADQALTSLFGVYCALTLLCALAYTIAGMSEFDAANHALTTLSTGGFSTSNASFAVMPAAAQWSAVVFMLLGGLPFVLYVRAIQGWPGALVRDVQVRAFLGFVLAVWVGLSLYLSVLFGIPVAEALRHSAFNVVSILTTTGFVSSDYTNWGALAVGLFFFLTFLGACAGSTSGGFKMFRIQLCGLMLYRTLIRLLQPSRVTPLSYNTRSVSEDVLASVAGFSILYVTSVVALTFGLALTGLDFLSAMSGAATAISNVGPGIGPIIGPAGSFADVPDAAKWMLCLGMLLGRVEIVTLLILLSPGYWRY